MIIHRIFDLILPFFRRRRMAYFLEIFRPGPGTRILDVGGGLMHWTLAGCRSPITILNVKIPSESLHAPANFAFVKGDGTDLGYPDGAFDLAFSNSVIEHLGTRERQVKFAAEISRMAGKLWVQTPAREFFMEPHLLTPFLHFLPKAWQARLLRRCTLWGLLTRPTKVQVRTFLEETRLLSYGEMRSLFPDCEIATERFLFMPKSYIAVRNPGRLGRPSAKAGARPAFSEARR